MFIQVWTKYIPVIALLVKKSAKGEQELGMNHTDFERAAGGKRIKYSFSGVLLDNGRLSTIEKLSPFAREFAQLLTENESTRALLKGQRLEFSMTNDFRLLIQNKTANHDQADNETGMTETMQANDDTAS